MKTVKKTIYLSIFGVMCLVSCGRNNNQTEAANDTLEDSIATQQQDGIDTEMDSLVSPDTVMPAP